MSDRNSGGHHSRTLTLRRLGWLGAVMLLGAALLIPGTRRPPGTATRSAAARTIDDLDDTSTTSTTSTDTTATETSDVSGRRPRRPRPPRRPATTDHGDDRDDRDVATVRDDTDDRPGPRSTDGDHPHGDRWRRWRDRHAGGHPAVDELPRWLVRFERRLAGHPAGPGRHRRPEPDPSAGRPEEQAALIPLS